MEDSRFRNHLPLGFLDANENNRDCVYYVNNVGIGIANAM